MKYVGLFIIVLGLINVIRMSVFLIGSNIYSIREHFQSKRWKGKHITKALPKFTVVIPAHNESMTVLAGLDSVRKNTYPKHKLEIIVVDDGSTDDTLQLLRNYKKKYKSLNLVVVSQKNAGKAHAMNNALRNYATGDLVMCLDADSTIDRNAVREAVRYFEDSRVVAVAANVRIKPTGSILNFTQRMEYLVGYQLKRALTVYNVEFIVGGVGSVFKREILKKVGYYDTNTITEDIDLTVKLLQLGNKENRVVYGSRIIAYTEAVMNLKDLIRQRYRWKYGRNQTFFKHSNLFFNTDAGQNKLLTFFYLPFVVFSDILFALEPLMIAYLVGLSIYYHDISTFITSLAIVTFFVGFNVLSEDSLSKLQRAKLVLAAPLMYLLFYIINLVDYIALAKSVWQIRQTRKSIKEGSAEVCSWEHVERAPVKA